MSARACSASMPPLTHETHIATLGEVLTTWLIAPLIFFFLIRDTGEIKRGLLSVVPNRLFEPALTLMDDLDNALGDWARGLFLECCLLGLTLMVLLAAVGIPWRWAMQSFKACPCNCLQAANLSFCMAAWLRGGLFIACPACSAPA